MIDWHSHVLPAMDDGSRDVAESISMLEMLASQGVDRVVATPHFYANDESVESFLDRRRRSYDRLRSQLPDTAPTLLLGAEVRYYQGISRLADLKALRIENSPLLLLEMPMCRWTESMLRELEELAGKGGMYVVLAHIDRYWGIQPRHVWERLAASGILMQINAGFLTAFATRRKALALLREGRVQFVGSDSHNTTSRSPRIGKAFDVVRKKFGDEYLPLMNEYGASLLDTQ